MIIRIRIRIRIHIKVDPQHCNSGTYRYLVSNNMGNSFENITLMFFSRCLCAVNENNMLEEAGLLEDTSMLGENSMLEDSSIMDSSAMEDSGMINSSINNSTLNTGDEVS
jgi:hypothetical protein